MNTKRLWVIIMKVLLSNKFSPNIRETKIYFVPEKLKKQKKKKNKKKKKKTKKEKNEYKKTLGDNYESALI